MAQFPTIDPRTRAAAHQTVMTTLTLAPTRKIFGIGDKDDYAILDGHRVIGRVFLSPASPPDRNWMWTITAPEYAPSIQNRGYSATREEAMIDFKARWLA